MSTPSQIPASTVELGFGGGTIACMIRQSQGEEHTGTLELVPDENGDDKVAVVSNRGKRITADGVMLASATVPKLGETVTLNGATYIVDAPPRVSRTATVARVSLSLLKNDANSWSSSTQS